jgi:hypothetical protein
MPSKKVSIDLPLTAAYQDTFAGSIGGADQHTVHVLVKGGAPGDTITLRALIDGIQDSDVDSFAGWTRRDDAGLPLDVDGEEIPTTLTKADQAFFFSFDGIAYNTKIQIKSTGGGEATIILHSTRS